MDSFVETSKAFHSLELSQFLECPIEPNTKLKFDPRYNLSDTAAFQTTDYNLMTENGVMSMLIGSSGYL
jgi:hypothetical protein